MSWSQAIYVQFPDEPTARALALQLGVKFPEDGSTPAGNHNYALCAPIMAPWSTSPAHDAEGNVVVPGVPQSGYWAMLRLNTDWAGHDATLAAIEAAGVTRALADPPVVWA